MKQMKQKRRRQTKKKSKSKKQKGGFAPSIAGGLANAVYLTPFAIRAGMKLLSRKRTRKH